MNSDQARFILRAFRPGLDRRDAPEFAEAFDQLQQDPQLAQWFEQEMAVDTAIRKKLAEAVAFPPGLKERIAAMGKVARPSHQIWWHRPGLLALAASLMLLATFGLSQLIGKGHRGAAFAEFRASVVTASQEMPHVSFMDSRLASIQTHLRSTQAPDEFVIPEGLGEASFKGCRVLEWNGKKVSLICLHLQDGRHVDLLVVREVEWDETGPGAGPVFAHVGAMNTASWSRNGRTYILSAGASDEELRRLVSVG